VSGPRPSVLLKGEAKISSDPEINTGKIIWQQFDVLSDGRILTAPITIRETALWSVDLTYVD
jgi:hypothetical protein